MYLILFDNHQFTIFIFSLPWIAKTLYIFIFRAWSYLLQKMVPCWLELLIVKERFSYPCKEWWKCKTLWISYSREEQIVHQLQEFTLNIAEVLCLFLYSHKYTLKNMQASTTTLVSRFFITIPCRQNKIKKNLKPDSRSVVIAQEINLKARYSQYWHIRWIKIYIKIIKNIYKKLKTSFF